MSLLSFFKIFKSVLSALSPTDIVISILMEIHENMFDAIIIKICIIIFDILVKISHAIEMN